MRLRAGLRVLLFFQPPRPSTRWQIGNGNGNGDGNNTVLYQVSSGLKIRLSRCGILIMIKSDQTRPDQTKPNPRFGALRGSGWAVEKEGERANANANANAQLADAASTAPHRTAAGYAKRSTWRQSCMALRTGTDSAGDHARVRLLGTRRSTATVSYRTMPFLRFACYKAKGI